MQVYVCFFFVCVFFFKQKTAYEMRISDWSSDVCSSDLAKDWRTERRLGKLEALLAVADSETSLIISGNGDVIEPEDGLIAIGSGGPFALSAARALLAHSALDARGVAEEALKIAADICIYKIGRAHV